MFYNVSNNSKNERDVAYLTYKKYINNTSQWSVLFLFDAKGKFWLGTHDTHACICIAVTVTVIYHAN